MADVINTYPMQTPVDWTRPGDCTDRSSDVSRHVYGYESIGPIIDWRGGEHHYDGPHDTFCFVCGSPNELYECQTCENCYHSECMTDPAETPKFWFCPHCVVREYNVPPKPCPTSYFSPRVEDKRRTGYFSPEILDGRSSASQAGEVSSTLGIGQAKRTRNGENSTFEFENTIGKSPVTSVVIPTGVSGSQPHTTASNPHTHYPTPPSIPSVLPDSTPLPPPPAPTTFEPSGTRPRSSSPPQHPPHKKRKSKYSPFTPEIEKALSVITNELERATRSSSSSLSLKQEIESLERRVRMQDGQINLYTREIEVVRGKLKSEVERRERLEMERGDGRVRVLEDENRALRERVGELEREGRDWRSRLRELAGGS
ncbi:hypothetical protein BJ875DRAFT_492978 [Amylocarpus encephaloides]|uniref:PHD-type domain-containing protein n=1 Tax=Amylocarpus encephaloides TaxID=45428 RepID=A0A9P7YR75_9HELO|nr:hypothetical protein BJ875DRAFT_492978 [Amylocarpus encephaloides]